MWMIDGNKLKEKAVPLLFPTTMEPCGHLPSPVMAVAVDEIEGMLYREGVEMPEPARWIPVEECLPETIACNAGTAYSEAVIVWTTGKKAMIAVWDGEDFISPADFWEAEDEYITHWMPLPTPPKEDICKGCAYKSYYSRVAAQSDCNDCGKARSCEHRPRPGGIVRINCPLWRAKG